MFNTLLYLGLWWNGLLVPQIPNYTEKNIEGYRVYIENIALEEHPKVTQELLNFLQRSLAEINKMEMLPEAKATLKKVPFFLDWALKDAGACYHPSAEWLKENGYIVEKAKSINILNIEECVSAAKDQPYMILHELSHAYHDIYLGNDHPDILAAYQSAMSEGIYENVEYINGGTVRAYAATNEQEYFAELTEAFFGKNDFFPFDNQELESHDPDAYELLAKLWQGKDIKANPQPLPQKSGFSPDAYYLFVNKALGNSQSLDVVNDGKNNQLKMANRARVQGQYWRISSINAGYMRLTNQFTGEEKSLDVVNDGDKNDQLQLATTANASGQYWKISKLEDGYYRLTTLWQGEEKSLEVNKSGKIYLADTKDSDAQKWKFEKIEW